MSHTQQDLIRAKAAEWFHALERDLADMLQLETHTRRSMIRFEAEAKETLPRASITFRARYRDGAPLPYAVERVRLCGKPSAREHVPAQSGKPFKRWWKRLKGPPTRAEMFFNVKDVRLLPLYTVFDERKSSLNAARSALVLGGRQSIENRAISWSEPRPWEAGDLPWPAPLLLTRGLPLSSIRALAAAWRYFLRAAAVHTELIAIADRHNADPPLQGLRLSFRVDREHPYGRFRWTYNGTSLAGFARKLARETHRKRIDEASLPDRLLRQLRIPAPIRKAIAPHEARRRRMARIYATYVESLNKLFETSPRRMKEARKLLLRAGFPESRRIDAGPQSSPVAQ
jgi:hypothetical protein